MNNNLPEKMFTSNQIKEIDQYTISNEPIKSIDLMERAADKIFQWIINRYEPACNIKIFVGPGNNGGDGLAVARMLAQNEYSVEVFWVKFTDKCSEDWEINFKRLKDQKLAKIEVISESDKKPVINKDDLVIDAVFGSGLSRPLKGLPAEIVDHINASAGQTIAVDIPSGLFSEDNSGNNTEHIIKATYTLSLQFPKLAFFFACNENFVGAWDVLPIGLHEEKIKSTGTIYYYLTKNFVAGKLRERSKFSHKGTYGHSLLISGHHGRMGAAVLAARACLRTGTGLVTAHIPRKACDILQISVPEVMLSMDRSEDLFSVVPDLENFSALGIGPAIGLEKDTREAFRILLENIKIPMVIDADGINILGEHKEWLDFLPENTILTPHPKEFERIAGPTENGYERMQLLKEFAQKFKIFVVLKGAYTTVATPEGSCYFNTTGNPGMATAGSGDVLTGIILSLLGQGYNPGDAAITGVYVHGLAGDFAAEKMGEESLIANDIIDYLAGAFGRLK